MVTNQKCADLLKMHVHLPAEAVTLIKDGDTLDLGGRTLQFIFAPWVHWPETMFTHLREDKILFTCDFLGAHRATSDLFADDEAQAYPAAKRYYAEIIMPFRARLPGYIAKIESLGVDMIAASHGPVYRRPQIHPGRAQGLDRGAAQESSRGSLCVHARQHQDHREPAGCVELTYVKGAA